ncbi:sensor histidine kinase [Hymenobacter swuensis]|uniref:histidine kinase n=1 Tax=Hymenobacter swuensis DY53 TaxID=1227739 RepID=W8F371_9BACT|nr:PAS domain S-box protein [Hymenobacter swuensis]AHJ99398.1 histidine kinase [Hymenobacter swuensis DY53]
MPNPTPTADTPTAELVRLRAELALARAAQAQAEARATYYQQLFEQPRKAVVIVREGRYTDCNPMALHLLGLSRRDELLGRPIGSFSAPTQPDGRATAVRLADMLEQAHRLGWARFSWLGKRPNGEEFWEEMLITAIWLEGELLYHITWEDTSGRQPRPGSSHESENRLQLALAATASGVWISHLPTHKLYCDQRTRQILGITEAISSWEELQPLVHPEDMALLHTAFQRSVHQQQPFDIEFRLLHPTEGTRHLMAMGQVQLDGQHQPLRITGLLRDVTDRHRTRHELTLKNQLLERMLQNLPLTLGRFDRQGRLLELTGAGLRYLHVADNEGVGQLAGYLIPDMQEHIAQVLAGHTVRFVARGEAQGEPVYLQCFGFFDESQQCGVIFSINATESELSKERLRTEKEFTERLLNHSVDAIVACDAQGRITAWNRVMERLSGCAAATMLGQLLPEFPVFTPDTAQGAALHRLLAGQLTPHYNVPFHCHDQDCEANLLPLQLSDGAAHGVLVVIRDVTQRNFLAAQATQLQLRRQHEILAAVLEAQETERRRIAESLHNGVGQLLYAAKLSLPPTGEVHGTRSLLEEAIRATRTISFELTPGVLADFGLKTALEELLKRIPHHHLRVQLRMQHLPERLPAAVEMAAYRTMQELLNNILKHSRASEATLLVSYQQSTLHLSAEDNGIGFEAAPPTPEPPRGLGLTSIRHRVELLLGTLTVDSGPGRGTLVCISLPCSPEGRP